MFSEKYKNCKKKYLLLNNNIKNEPMENQNKQDAYLQLIARISQIIDIKNHSDYDGEYILNDFNNLIKELFTYIDDTTNIEYMFKCMKKLKKDVIMYKNKEYDDNYTNTSEKLYNQTIYNIKNLTNISPMNTNLLIWVQQALVELA